MKRKLVVVLASLTMALGVSSLVPITTIASEQKVQLGTDKFQITFTQSDLNKKPVNYGFSRKLTSSFKVNGVQINFFGTDKNSLVVTEYGNSHMEYTRSAIENVVSRFKNLNRKNITDVKTLKQYLDICKKDIPMEWYARINFKDNTYNDGKHIHSLDDLTLDLLVDKAINEYIETYFLFY